MEQCSEGCSTSTSCHSTGQWTHEGSAAFAQTSLQAGLQACEVAAWACLRNVGGVALRAKDPAMVAALQPAALHTPL